MVAAPNDPENYPRPICRGELLAVNGSGEGSFVLQGGRQRVAVWREQVYAGRFNSTQAVEMKREFVCTCYSSDPFRQCMNRGVDPVCGLCAGSKDLRGATVW